MSRLELDEAVVGWSAYVFPRQCFEDAQHLVLALELGYDSTIAVIDE